MTSFKLSNKSRLTLFFFCFFLATSKSLFAQSPDQLLVDVRNLLTANPPEPQQALEKLLKEEETYAGHLEFDYWLGIAATRQREPALALLALNRVLIQQPLHAGARIERVGAYLQLNRDQEALSDLDYLQTLQPPEQAQRVMDQYREILAERERRKNAPTHLYMLSLDAGYDTNVGRTPDGYQLCLSDLFCSADLFSEEASAYNTLRGVYRYRHPLGNESRIEATLLGQYRGYAKEEVERYNLGALQARVNWHHALTLDEFISIEGSLNRIWLDKPLEPYSWQAGINAAWERPVLTEATYRLGGHWRMTQHDEFKRNNFQLFGLDNQLRYMLSSQLQLRGNLLAEFEQASKDGPGENKIRDGGDLLHLRIGLGGLYQLSQQHSLGLNLSYGELRYQNAGFAIYNRLENIKREDQRLEVSADYTRMLTPHWMLQLQAIHRQQKSNLDFYENSQSILQAGISYIWQKTGR